VEPFSRAEEGVGTRDEVLSAECGAREQVDEKEIILHGFCRSLAEDIGRASCSFPKISETS